MLLRLAGSPFDTRLRQEFTAIHVVVEQVPGDRRVVLVSLTEAGAAALEDVRASYRAVLRDHLVAMSDDEIAVLLHATEALESLLGALQQGDAE